MATVLGHIGINVPDLETAKAYYDGLMPLLNFEEFKSSDDEFAYRPAGGKPGTFLFFYPALQASSFSRDQTGLQHLAFTVPNRSAVKSVVAAVEEMGATVLHEPQDFPQYPPPYFAAFWLDPFGIMLEVVCHHDRD